MIVTLLVGAAVLLVAGAAVVTFRLVDRRHRYPSSEDPPHDPDPWVRTPKVRWDPPPDTTTPEQAAAMWDKLLDGAPTETHTIKFGDANEAAEETR